MNEKKSKIRLFSTCFRLYFKTKARSLEHTKEERREEERRRRKRERGVAASWEEKNRFLFSQQHFSFPRFPRTSHLLPPPPLLSLWRFPRFPINFQTHGTLHLCQLYAAVTVDRDETVDRVFSLGIFELVPLYFTSDLRRNDVDGDQRRRTSRTEEWRACFALIFILFKDKITSYRSKTMR